MKKFERPIYEGEEWTPALLQRFLEISEEIAVEKCGLDLYPNEVKIVTSKQMEDAMVTGALPLQLYHWFYGMQSYQIEATGSRGYLEIVQNTNPCQLYCAENNTATEMLVVIAHAGCGHNAVYKNNFLFRQFTNPKGIVDYLIFARDFLRKCEEKYGEERVSDLMTACMALGPYSVDLIRKPKPRSYDDELARLQKRVEQFERSFNPVFHDRSSSPLRGQNEIEIRIPESPDENILKFIEKQGPRLRVIEEWEAEVTRIFRKINEYFYPHTRTKVVHEGAACTLQRTVFNCLSPLELGAVSNSAMNNFFDVHARVTGQPGYRWRDKFEGKIPLWGINHYSLGFQLFQDIERICREPTDEDRAWFPDLIGANFWEVFRHIIAEHDDESFIQTYFSPKLIRDYAFFALEDDPDHDYFEVTDIHNEEGYRHVRDRLAHQYAYHAALPNLEVASVDIGSGCALTLRHTQHDRVHLDGNSVGEFLFIVHRNLWPRTMRIESVDAEGKVTDLWIANEGKVTNVVPR